MAMPHGGDHRSDDRILAQISGDTRCYGRRRLWTGNYEADFWLALCKCSQPFAPRPAYADQLPGGSVVVSPQNTGGVISSTAIYIIERCCSCAI